MYECPMCKKKNIAFISDNKTAYGLVQLNEPDKVNLTRVIPVHVYVCKDCGHVELVHINPKAIQK